ncbi:prepilin-type N-terminal cleavage/methylation domain-containing protein [Candidatus Gottesmanbacteria bacterium]|nr:prepilin-type N-terminal cleavage/methylation domain-containing protein [Candidatus Gottesmanbacteria bacterium]
MKTARMHKGFTLIELLIVIALLGALAVGLLATIDPFEQLKKGRDTSTRNTVSEFYNANLRYYSTKAEFPWGTGVLLTAAAISGRGADITSLINAGELKNRFMELAGTGNLAKIYVSSTGNEHVAVCYRPESKSFQVDPNTVYASDATVLTSGCKSFPSGTADCYFCIQ